MSNHFSFDAAKRSVNLVDFAIGLGYSKNKVKSTRSSAVLYHTNGDKIVVSRKNGIWVYFSVVDESDNGTIIDFARKRLGEVDGNVFSERFSYPSKSQNPIDESSIDPKRVQRIFEKCQPIKGNHRYLEERGIASSILLSERFKNTVYKDLFGNVAFPHFQSREIVGLELKNEGFGVFVRGSLKTFWLSNEHPKDYRLAIAENAIDALSYFQMFKPKHTRFFALSGSPSKYQLELIADYLTIKPEIKEVVLIVDNDQGGDVLLKRLKAFLRSKVINGKIDRHSPRQSGLDWNDVLTQK